MVHIKKKKNLQKSPLKVTRRQRDRKLERKGEKTISLTQDVTIFKNKQKFQKVLISMKSESRGVEEGGILSKKQYRQLLQMSRLKAPSTIKENHLYQHDYHEFKFWSLRENPNSSQRKETGHRGQNGIGFSRVNTGNQKVLEMMSSKSLEKKLQTRILYQPNCHQVWEQNRNISQCLRS